MLALCRDLPVRQAAALLRCADKQLWRRIEFYVEQARALETFAGDAVIADVRHCVPGKAITPEILEQEARDKRQKEDEKEKKRSFPDEPQRDVLLFLLEHAPLRDWQHDILAIIRDEAYYFAPQGQTKIMNEGWASYWHSRIMTEKALLSPWSPLMLAVKAAATPEKQLETAYLALFSRQPSAEEQALWSKRKLSSAEDIVHALLNTKAFLFIE